MCSSKILLSPKFGTYIRIYFWRYPSKNVQEIEHSLYAKNKLDPFSHVDIVTDKKADTEPLAFHPNTASCDKNEEISRQFPQMGSLLLSFLQCLDGVRCATVVGFLVQIKEIFNRAIS